MLPDSQETRFQELKRYVRFDARDAALLLAFGERAAPEFPRIAQEFYDRIREHSGAHDVFTGEEQIQRLQRSMVLWLARICGGVYDEGYAAQTALIGRVHVKIGLPQRYMLTSMALIRVALLRIADRQLGDRAAPTREALLRVLDLELAVMLQTYKDSFSERIREVGRLERSQLGDALSRTEHRYINAVELASVMIVGLDASGVICLVNREAERVTGFDRDQLLGQAFLSIMVADEPTPRLPEQLREGLGGRAPSQWVDCVLRTRAGKHRDVTWNLAFAGEQAGDDVVLFAIGRDLGPRPRRAHASSRETCRHRHAGCRLGARDSQSAQRRSAPRLVSTTRNQKAGQRARHARGDTCGRGRDQAACRSGHGVLGFCSSEAATAEAGQPVQAVRARAFLGHGAGRGRRRSSRA
jgi:PAS domain S-box-containing protein